VLELTHRQLAVELGTAREVVSRLIKDFERKGLVKLGRNKVTILQVDRMRDVANRDKNS
jgi:CRP/FNR family transcriptional regulator